MTKTSTVNLPKNGGNLEWQIVTLVVEDDKNMSTVLKCLNDEESQICCEAERIFLNEIGGGKYTL